MRTKHPAAGCTRAQRKAFERIAINDDTGINDNVVAALLAKGLIVRGDDLVLGGDRFGSIKVPSYFVPLPLHMQWCQWASEQCDGEED